MDCNYKHHKHLPYFISCLLHSAERRILRWMDKLQRKQAVYEAKKNPENDVQGRTECCHFFTHSSVMSSTVQREILKATKVIVFITACHSN